MCSTDVYCSKQTGSSSTRNHHPSFLRFWVGRRKLSMQPKFVAAQKVFVKQKPANIRKWIARFYCFRHLYSAGSACVLLTIIAWVAHRYGQLYLHCSLIYFWVPSSCFAWWSASLWGWNNPVQRCLPVGGRAALSTPEAVVASHWLTDCFDVQPTTTSGSIITQSIIFQLLLHQLTPSCILHRAQQHHADASACQ